MSDMLDQDRTVDFSTDLQPETEDEGTLTEQEVAKILRNRISEVSGAESRGSNLVKDIWGSIVNPSDKGPGLGQFREESTNDAGSQIRANPQRTLAEKLAKILPDDMKKRSILENGDVRALLQKIMIAPAQADRGDTFTINGVDFTANERAAAGLILVEMTDKIRDSFAENVRSATADPALVEEVIAGFEQEVLYDYRDGVMHSSMPIDEAHFGSGAYGRDADGNPVPLGGSATSATNTEMGVNYDTTATGEGDEFPFYTDEEVTNLFATTYDQNQTVQQIYATEAQQREGATGTGGRTTGREVSVQYDDKDTTSYYNTPDHLQGQAARENEKVTKAKKLTLTQMANKPKEMSREQIISLSKKMEAAGIYEMIGEKPQIPGDWTDSAFKKGYERLMGLAVEKGKSMTSLLADRTSHYQKALEDALSTRLTDPARVRRSVDETGRNILGRAMTAEEHQELTAFVHDLERRNAKTEAAMDPELTNIGGMEDLDEGILADIDARLADKIQMDNLDESSAKSVQKQYDTFSSFLAGPGRGI